MISALFTGSKHAVLYSKFRPCPPQQLIDAIIDYMRSKDHYTLKDAIDVGCGSGQSTIALAPYFERVTGFDISEAQIESARSNRSAPNIEYKVANCLKLPISAATIQLATFSQSVHWFNTAELFTEVQRILVPKGVVAVYGYWIPLPKTENAEKNKKLSDLISEEFHEKQLGKFWDDERYIVQSHYANLVFPFKDVQRLNLIQKTESSLSDYIGYLSTWSAYQKLWKEDNKKGETLLKDVEKQCLSILNENKRAEEIILPLNTDFFMMIGHC